MYVYVWEAVFWLKIKAEQNWTTNSYESENFHWHLISEEAKIYVCIYIYMSASVEAR